jgi:hypothetical protein
MNRSRIATSDPVGSARQSAERLVAAMPRLVLEARRVAASVFHGLHGRRRAGPGENFWQYRRFHSARRATIISTSASANGRRPTPSGSGPTARRRWSSAPGMTLSGSSTARWCSLLP